MNKKIKQPTWCDYPGADVGMIGCRSLWLGLIKKRDCKKCKFYKEEV